MTEDMDMVVDLVVIMVVLVDMVVLEDSVQEDSAEISDVSSDDLSFFLVFSPCNSYKFLCALHTIFLEQKYW